MRARLLALVAATSSLVLVAFLVPMALLVRATVADRVEAAAISELDVLAPAVARLDTAALTEVVTEANGHASHPVTVYLPDGRVLGAPALRSRAVDAAMGGRSLSAPAPGGREVLVAVAGLRSGTAVIRTFVSDAELRRGVLPAWLVLGALGVGLMLVSGLVADQLARTLTRPLSNLAGVAHRLAHGDLSARAHPGGSPEIQQVGTGLNLLATQISDLLAAERELVADLSHRLRTPLTAVRVDAESLPDPEDRARLADDVDRLERAVNSIIWEARQGVRSEARCNADEVVAERVRFWAPLADEERRPMDIRLPGRHVPVRVSGDDLAAATDALLGNVFAHTPEGCGLTVRLVQRPGGGAVLTVVDDGPGLPGPQVLERGRSGSGSTGLGLDIVRRVAARSGGSASFGNRTGGGASITIELGSPIGG
jgi:signal transduction histidine kinase